VASDPASTSALLKTFLNNLRCSSRPLFSLITSTCSLASRSPGGAASLSLEVLPDLSSSRSTFSLSSSTVFSRFHRSLPSPPCSGRLPSGWRSSWRSRAGTPSLLLLMFTGSRSSERRWVEEEEEEEEEGWSADGFSALPPGPQKEKEKRHCIKGLEF